MQYITFEHEDGSTGPHACSCNEPSPITGVYGILVTNDPTPRAWQYPNQ